MKLKSENPWVGCSAVRQAPALLLPTLSLSAWPWVGVLCCETGTRELLPTLLLPTLSSVPGRLSGV